MRTYIELIRLIDEPANMVDAVFAFYEAQNIELAEIERPLPPFL